MGAHGSMPLMDEVILVEDNQTEPSVKIWKSVGGMEARV